MEDKKIVCKDCGQEFVFTVGEQEFYASKGFTNDPDGNGNIEINSSGDTASWGYSSLINKDTTEDYNLYAKWKLKQYRIVLNKNDDTVTKDYLYVKYEDTESRNFKFKNSIFQVAGSCFFFSLVNCSMVFNSCLIAILSSNASIKPPLCFFIASKD